MPRMNERQRLMLAGAIQAASKSCSSAQLARRFHVSWKTASMLRKMPSDAFPSPKRSLIKRVAKRREAVEKLALKTKQKHHHVWPAHPSARSIRNALPGAFGTPSVSTILRDLHQSGFVSRVRRFVPTREPSVIHKRFLFARKERNSSRKKLLSYVFSDEHYVSTNDSSSRRMWVRRKGRVLTRERKRMQNVPHLQIWAAVGVGYKSPIVLFPQTEDGSAFRLNGEKYVRRCLSQIAPSLTNRIFVQDGARPHVKKNVKSYLSRKEIKWVEDWPPYSPDLNPIEKVWALLNARIGELRPTTMEQLMSATKEAWNRIPQAEIDKYCAWYASRIEEVYQKNGQV